MDAIELLKKDHQEVTKLFQRYHGSKNERGGKENIDRICRELEVHAQIEEEIFYPAVREADRQLAEKVEEALREHARMKQDMAALHGGQGDVEGMMTTLQQDVEHHVTEEEGEMFPRVSEVIDQRRRAELGQRLAARKRELTGEAARPARRAAGKTRRTGRKTASQRGGRTKTGRRHAKTSSTKSRARKTRRKTARGGRSR